MQPNAQPVPDEESLSDRKSIAASALAAGRSIAASARSAGVHRSTIYDWLNHDPAFHAAMDNARRHHADSLAGFLRDLADTALQQLHTLMTRPDVPHAVRLRACLAVLNRPIDPAWSRHFPLGDPVEDNPAESGASGPPEAVAPPPNPTESDTSDTFAQIVAPAGAPDLDPFFVPSPAPPDPDALYKTILAIAGLEPPPAG